MNDEWGWQFQKQLMAKTIDWPDRCLSECSESDRRQEDDAVPALCDDGDLRRGNGAIAGAMCLQYL
ncbi:MAG: hypothetical protein JNN16_17090 [Nitrospira sp.]|nr:hypothetical protein [Nitrospira sp.]